MGNDMSANRAVSYILLSLIVSNRAVSDMLFRFKKAPCFVIRFECFHSEFNNLILTFQHKIYFSSLHLPTVTFLMKQPISKAYLLIDFPMTPNARRSVGVAVMDFLFYAPIRAFLRLIFFYLFKSDLSKIDLF